MSIKTLIITGCAVLLSASVGVLAQETGAGDEKPARACCLSACAKEGAAKMRCSLTGETVDSCCCVHREGKLHCNLADKDVESCCCAPVTDETDQTDKTDKTDQTDTTDPTAKTDETNKTDNTDNAEPMQ